MLSLHDETLATRLISELLNTSNTDHMHPLGIIKVLSSFGSPATIERLVEFSQSHSVDGNVRAWFARVLSISAGAVSLVVFEQLASDVDGEVRAYAIRGLGRFSFEQAKEIVLAALHPPAHDISDQSGFSYAHVQKAALEVLAKFDQFELLAEPQNQPEYLYNTSAEVLFDFVASRHLSVLQPLLLGYINRLRDPRTKIH